MAPYQPESQVNEVILDWLTDQDWTDVINSIEITYPDGHPEGVSKSTRCFYHEAHIAITNDETAIIQIPDDLLNWLIQRRRASRA